MSRQHQEEQLSDVYQSNKNGTIKEDFQMYQQLQAFLRDLHGKHDQKPYLCHKRLPYLFSNNRELEKNIV